jgi:hypothetical protein
MKRIIGISIAGGVSIGAAIALLFAHANINVSVGIAVAAILLGTAIARGRFSAKPEGPGANSERRTANDHRPTTNS